MIMHNSFRKGKLRHHMFLVIPAFIAFLLLLAANTYGRDVSFIWSANSETVDGYRVYYKTGSSGGPYNGTGVAEGSSPVAAGNVTSFTLHGLSDTETYYFALTAYRGEDESGYSTEIVLPAVTPSAVGRDVSFVWTANSETVDGYRLYYKTGGSGPPYNGSGAAEGDSPVLTGNVTAFTLHGLSGTETYYFALTAYLGEAESSFTEVIVLPPSSVNSPPTANNAMVSVIEDTPLSGQLSATDPDGNALTYSIVTNGTKGGAVITNFTAGAFTYTPSPNRTGSDSFTFMANDGTVNSNIATVAVTITAVNDAPTAAGTSVTTNEDTAVSGHLSATDPDGDALTYSIVTNGTKGSAAITNPATGVFTYTPSENQSGSDSFTFRANDGTVNSNTATVAVTITAVNDAPTATGTSVTTTEDTAVSGQLFATDPDGDALTYSIVTNGTKGSAALTSPTAGTFTYTPDQNQSGSDSFTFKVNDGTNDSGTATVTVTIEFVNYPPAVADTSISTIVNTAVSGQLPVADQDGDTLTCSIVVNGTKGSAVITNPATGAFTYTPNQGQVGDDAFTFKVNDGTVNSAVATISVAIFDASTLTKVFGDTSGADYPGTLADTYANINADINAAAEVVISYSWSSSVPYKVANTIILKADLTSIQAYATVEEAKLYLYQTVSKGEFQYKNSVHKIIGKNPIISQVTGYNAFNGEFWSPVPEGTTHNNIPLGLGDIDPPEDTIPLFNREGYRSWTITRMVQEWVATPSTNYGLLIQGEETEIGTGRTFAAKENQNAALRPKLVVRYRLVPQAPQLILIEEIK